MFWYVFVWFSLEKIVNKKKDFCYQIILFELNFKNLNYVIWTIFIYCFLPFIYTTFLEFKSHGTTPPPLVKTDIYSLCCISLAWMVPNHFHTCFWCETLCNGWLSPISHAHCFCCLLCVSVYASSSSLNIGLHHVLCPLTTITSYYDADLIGSVTDRQSTTR